MVDRCKHSDEMKWYARTERRNGKTVLKADAKGSPRMWCGCCHREVVINCIDDPTDRVVDCEVD